MQSLSLSSLCSDAALCHHNYRCFQVEIEHWNGNCDVYLVHTVHDSESHAGERSDKVSLCPVRGGGGSE